ncbi:MAG: class I SAM-dependent methyltransferase [Gammaproteobacteria bacterium]|nr:class I SAM-dependent methyltransferase [Sideroxydans sp.]MBU3903652.1 class I SAM-dependent methyltransferase [Gammaproteobacteria bacterium]MBU4045338.1 class I SAM-dependent methyltransferase [Gammaproteobacteria bacterium]MBU4151209.1 class I SAM-dependent methyltransferase [Gammaproteobacteria bacterium]
MSVWDERYSGEDYFYGTEPNAFLISQHELLKPGLRCLAVADGEGRNGVWLAEQGLDVLSLDASPVAQAKAKRLAQTRGVTMRFEQADLLGWRSDERFDVVAAIFIQFVGPELRPAQFENLKRHLKPGGLLLLQGYTPRQLDFKTGGPSQVENLYSATMLRELCADMEIVHLGEHDSVIHEGTGHSGMSALIDLVARAR